MALVGTKQHGTLFGSRYQASIKTVCGTLDIDITLQQINT